MKQDKFGCITYREFRTGGGQLVEVWCPPDEADRVLEVLKDIKNFDIRIPSTKQVKELDGGKHGRYTRYDVTQIKREGSWLEVLQINDPLDGRCGNILLTWLSSAREDRTFFEFDTIENACEAFIRVKKTFGKMTEGQVLKTPGCLRMVRCLIFEPWFYAVAGQALWEDVVFPNVVEEDNYFRFGRKYVVRDYHGISSIKICVSVEQKVHKDYYGEKENQYRLVFWDDGTRSEYWESDRKKWPGLLNESHLWIQDAMDSFRELISGVRKKFEIPFRDGSKFVGQWKPPKPNDKTCAGYYRASLILESGEKIEGEFDFEPTSETPTAVDSLAKQAKEKKVKIKEILSLARTRGGSAGKKWAGVF